MELIAAAAAAGLGIAGALVAALWRRPAGACLALLACTVLVAVAALPYDAPSMAAVVFVQAGLGLAVLLAALGRAPRRRRPSVAAAVVGFLLVAAVLWAALLPVQPTDVEAAADGGGSTSLVLSAVALVLLAGAVGVSAIRLPGRRP